MTDIWTMKEAQEKKQDLMKKGFSGEEARDRVVHNWRHSSDTSTPYKNYDEDI